MRFKSALPREGASLGTPVVFGIVGKLVSALPNRALRFERHDVALPPQRVSPRFLSSLAIRTWPNAGCSIRKLQKSYIGADDLLLGSHDVRGGALRNLTSSAPRLGS